MVSRTTTVISRAIGLGSVATSMFVICTSAYVLATDPTTPPQQGTPKSEGTPAPSPTPETRSRSDCERYVAVLSGRAKDRALLDNPDVEALARQVPDLVTCGAVLSDSDEFCKPLADQGRECRKRWSTYHELRAAPKSRAFVFPDTDYEECRAEKTMAPYCDAVREAARSGDPSKCPSGLLQSFCRAVVSLDKSLCRAVKEPEGADKECEKQVALKAPFARGLSQLAKSGPPLDRSLAKAAQGQADACEPYAARAMKICLAKAPTAAADETAPPPPSREGSSRKQPVPKP